MKEKISALMDDELDMSASAQVFVALKKDEELLERWSIYHRIGDAMRGNPEFSDDFYSRLMQRIDQEPAVLAPKRRLSIKHHPIMSVAASLAAVMVVGWVLLQQGGTASDAPAYETVAQNTLPAQAVDAYLVAHRQLSPESVTPAVYYLRPVDYSGNGN